MTAKIESVVLCEGYDDRAFWAELLERRFHFRDARGTRGRAIDPFGTDVTSGQFAFLSPSDHFVRVRPCMGRSEVFESLEDRLARRFDRPARRIVVSVDNDAATVEASALSQEAVFEAVAARVHRADASFERRPNGELILDSGSTTISIAVWSSQEDFTDLPRKQTLERLVCAALRAAYPQRSRAVASWLMQRPEPPFAGLDERRLSLEPKEHAHSHFAGWFAEHGCDDFFRAVWRDKKIAEQLEARLRQSGVWRVVEALAA